MVCRFFELGQVVQRHSESFGIFPVHKTEAGTHDALFSGLRNPFYAADFRKWQVLQPDSRALETLDASVIALEKMRPHVPYERAVMGLRISKEWAGVQFHPEADPEGMGLHFREPDRRAFVIDHHGEEKYKRILHRLDDPNYIERTHRTLIPNFFRNAVNDPH
jgi:GMP synthase-like glutamine amidotransferase